MTVPGVGRPGDAWAVDETGLAFGILGEFRIRTVYQPVFERRGDVLTPVAVTASAALHRGGKDLGSVRDAAFLDLPGRRLAARLEAELAIRNHPNLGCEDAGLDLLVRIDGTARLDAGALADLLSIADEAPVDRSLLRFDVGAVATSLGSPIDLAELSGCSLAADVSAAAGWPGSLADLRPGVVRLAAPASRLLIDDDATLNLLPALSHAVTVQGGVLQVEGIDSPMLLRRALAAGCTRLQGDLLAPPALAGTEFDPDARPVAGFLAGGRRHRQV